MVDLVRVESAQILSQALAGLPARKRKLGIGPTGMAQGRGAPVLWARQCDRLAGLDELDLEFAYLAPDRAAMRLASQPARMSSAGSSLSPDTTADVIDRTAAA